MNGDLEDDDDFGDFGGFEEADPVEPLEAQPAPGYEAGPSPWAMFPGTQPDLIQPRPSSHQSTGEFLSTPQEDILGARPINAPIPTHDSYPSHGNRDLEPSFDEVIQQHQIPMAMGSPRGLPDLGQPIDLGQAHEIDHGAGLLEASGPDVSQVATSKRQPDITPDPVMKGPNLPPDLPGAMGTAAALDLDIDGDGLYAGGFNHSDGQLSKESESGISLDIDSPELVNGDSNTHHDNVDQGQAKKIHQGLEEKEKMKLEKELSEVLTQQAHLEEVLVKCQQELKAQKDKYQVIQTKHAEELESLRKAGHDTLAIVVEEYKELSKMAILEQKEINERRLKMVVEEQSDVHTQIMKQHEGLLQTKLQDERKNLEDYLKDMLKNEQEKQQEMLRVLIAEEQAKSVKAVEKALEEERLSSEAAIQTALVEEKKKTTAFIQEERVNFQTTIEQERKTSADLIRINVEEEIQKCQNSIHTAIEKEHRKCTELLKDLKIETKENFQQYIQEQRQHDASSRRHLLSATDLFLDSARQQIGLLINDTKPSNVNENGESD